MPLRPQTQRLVYWSLAVTLVALTTLLIRIPNSVNGYVNLGDSMIFALALVGGPAIAGVAGGVGSALADILGGYAHYALPTLLIKGFEGLWAGLLIMGIQRLKTRYTLPLKLAALALAGLWMAGGYFITAWFYYGTAAAWASLPGDLFQAGISIPLGLALYHILKPVYKTGL